MFKDTTENNLLKKNYCMALIAVRRIGLFFINISINADGILTI